MCTRFPFKYKRGTEDKASSIYYQIKYSNYYYSKHV